MKELENMKVAELKEESRKRGLTLESKGHKFTKPELIERIKTFDAEMVEKDIQSDIDKAIDEAAENIEDVKHEEVKEIKPERKLPNIDELEKKYAKRKSQWIYDEKLQVGVTIVFVHYVEAANGNIYKKLRKAKVIGVNRKRELVRVETKLGTQKELAFEDVMFIKEDDEKYPFDIYVFFREQRAENERAREERAKRHEGFKTRTRG